GRTALALDPAAPPGRAGRAGRPGTHPGPDPQDAFQAVFTSGSLGRPKCVTTTYAAVANRLDWFLETYPLLPGDVVAVHKDVSLVGSPVEILTGLLGGAALCFLDRDTLLDPDELWEAVEEHRVSHLLASPPVLELLLASAPPAGGGAALRLAASSAQGLSADLAGRWRRRFPRTRLLNMYGLTETASNVSCFEVTDDSPGHGGTVPVGHPIPGCRIHLLGPGGHPVPAGETGEIHLGGVCLARGYTGPDGDTAARFVPGPPPGRERLFRTGDTGRWTDRGLEVLGRTDTQIKIRGYKVMPEEVEALLSALPDVTGAAALAVGDPLDARELVAFVEGPAGVDTAAAARALAQQLPAAARPSRIVQVARIPRTASGKVDRVRLPELLDAPAPAAPPPTASCAAVVEAVWKRVLEVEQAGPDDDFFQTLGGHSLKATSAIAALRRELGVKVPLRMIFDRPVLADFVTALDAFTAERGARAGA
ncbi:non-ribosomal peptide synthetase, partial [Kitasatospora sp. NPDC004272]